VVLDADQLESAGLAGLDLGQQPIEVLRLGDDERPELNAHWR
jgi:hypothetical protein